MYYYVMYCSTNALNGEITHFYKERKWAKWMDILDSNIDHINMPVYLVLF